MADTLARRVGRHVANLRNARRWNQDDLAAQLGRTRTFIADVEGGRYENIGILRLEQICVALSVSVKEFFESLPGE